MASLTQILPNLLKFSNYSKHINFQNLFLHRKKEEVVKAFLFNILTLDYDCREGFLRRKHLAEKKTSMCNF